MFRKKTAIKETPKKRQLLWPLQLLSENSCFRTAIDTLPLTGAVGWKNWSIYPFIQKLTAALPPTVLGRSWTLRYPRVWSGSQGSPSLLVGKTCDCGEGKPCPAAGAVHAGHRRDTQRAMFHDQGRDADKHFRREETPTLDLLMLQGHQQKRSISCGESSHPLHRKQGGRWSA